MCLKLYLKFHFFASLQSVLAQTLALDHINIHQISHTECQRLFLKARTHRAGRQALAAIEIMILCVSHTAPVCSTQNEAIHLNMRT